MIYKQFKETELFEGPTNKTYEYNIEDNDINYCIAEINGRLPAGEKWIVNHKCKELVHVLSGTGELVFKGGTIRLKENDVVLIDIGEKYYWKGSIKIGCSCTPAWYPEQHEEVD